MVAALDTVALLIARARILLLDQVEPYRYPDADLIAGLNEACMEAKRLRPDLFLRTFDGTLPYFTTSTDSLVGKIPDEYRPAFIYYLVGNAQLRDDEDTQDNRAASLINKFVSQLTVFPS